MTDVPERAGRAAYFRRYRAERKAGAHPLPRSRNRGRKGDDSLWRTGEFVAIDGEGVTIDGAHLYDLLSSSTPAAISVPRGQRLSTEQCFEFLLDCKVRHPRGIFVCYGATYDVNNMLRDLDFDVLEALWKGEAPVTFRLPNGRLYEAQYRKGKMLTLGRYAAGGKLYRLERGRWAKNFEVRMTLWDVLGFFQSSFVVALRAYFGDREEFDFIARMKGLRGDFATVAESEIARYNDLENVWLVRLMDELRRHLITLGLTLGRFDGAGAIAAAIFALHETKRYKGEIPAVVAQAARYAFSGGRIEMTHIGRSHAPVYDHDINSAYPFAISTLPCLAHGTWEKGRRSRFSLVRVRWEFPQTLPWYPLFARTAHNSIAYGYKGENWFWKPEFSLALAFAKKHGGTVKVLDSYQWTQTCSHTPFAFVRQLYAERLKLKDAGSRTEHVVKLALNSLYGKFSQQLGGTAEKLPPFFQLEWAGFVTASTRAQLGMAALGRPRDVLAFATDGILARRPLDVPVGLHLGAWKTKVFEDAILVMPGVYYTKENGKWSVRGRGFDLDPLARARGKINRAWRDGLERITVPSTRFVTLGSALHSDELWDAWCSFRTIPRELSIDGTGSKRTTPRRYGKGRSPAEGLTFCPPSQLYLSYLNDHDASFAYELRWETNRADSPEDGTLDGVPVAIVEKELDASI